MAATVPGVVGREEELRTACAALAGGTSGVVVVRGEPGIGKTSLWEAVAAAAGGRPPLVARPVEAERSLAWAVLTDLLEPVLDRVAPALPAPQRRALEGALLLADAGSAPLDARTVGAALVGSLRLLGGERGALLAVDDFQWVDAASRSAIAFALRRLSVAGASALLTVRLGDADGSLPAFDARSHVSIVELGPLSVGALQRLLAERRDLRLPRPLLQRLHAAAGGNPLYALEIARVLGELESPLRAGAELPLPRDLQTLLRKRLGLLRPSTRRALAAAATLAEPRVEWVEAEGDLQPALDADVARIELGLVRFNHPLLASTAYGLLTPSRQRELHARLADAVDDLEQRARHLALAHPRGDATVAEALEAAAARAFARGAPAIAGELLELAVERTVDAEHASSLRLDAARAYQRGGDVASARRLAEESVAELAPGPRRAGALIILSSARRDDFALARALAEQARREARGDRVAEALAASRLSYFHGYAGDMQTSLALAHQALERVGALPDAAAVGVLATAAFMELLTTGRVDRALLARGLAAEERAGGLSEGWEMGTIVGHLHLLEERYDEARTIYEKLIAHGEALGYELRVEDCLNMLCEVETRSGRPAVGAAVAARADAVRERLGLEPSAVVLSEYFAAHAAAYLGEVERVRELTAAGIAASAAVGEIAFGMQHVTVLGFLELSLGNPAAAVEVLEPVARKLAESLPGAHPMHVPVLPNLIDALISLDRIDEAVHHLTRLEERGRELDSAWALAQAARSRALLAAAEGDTAGALAQMEQALREHERSQGPFELGRTRLAYGSVLRRCRRWREARESLTTALAIFEQMEAPLWTERARAELSRIGGRRSAHGLTPTEERIARLVADGRSNKEIANELFVAVRTVETHLTNVYGKLGLRSRTELAARRP